MGLRETKYIPWGQESLTDALDVVAGPNHLSGDVIVVDTRGRRVNAPVWGKVGKDQEYASIEHHL